MLRHFKRLQGVDVQVVRQAARQLGVDAWNGQKLLFGLQCAAKTLQLRPSAGGQHLRQSRGDRAPNGGQRYEAFAASGREYVADRPVEAFDDGGRVLVSRDPEPFGPCWRKSSPNSFSIPAIAEF